MQILYVVSDLVIPLLIFSIVGMGLLMKRDIYGDFIKGAKDGMRSIVSILPTLVGLMVGVGVLLFVWFYIFMRGEKLIYNRK